MTESLYSMDVLRLAAAVAEFPPLPAPDLSRECRSPTCGSRVTVSACLDPAQRISAIGVDAKACALGQAAATLLARGAVGKSAGEIMQASEAWRAYLAGETDQLPSWPGLDVLAPGRGYPARHASMRLAFEALSQAFEAIPSTASHDR